MGQYFLAEKPAAAPHLVNGSILPHNNQEIRRLFN